MKFVLCCIFFYVCTMSCTTQVDRGENETVKIANKVITEIKQERDTSFTLIKFEHKNDPDIQYIKVRWLSVNRIEFELVGDFLPCTFKQNGFAVKQANFDHEIDEDPQGLAYPSDEYFVEENGQLISIRIEYDKKRYCKIRYEYDEIGDECDPVEEVCMIRIE